MPTPKHFPTPRFPAFTIACLSLSILLAVAASASPTVVVISPKGGAASGSPVFYEAYATSAGCAAGISAMRILTAPGVTAFKTGGAHIEHFVTLVPGSYSTEVQAWDNCGGSTKAAVDLTVDSTAGVSVFLPNHTSAEWPVHVAASAQNPSCPTGISALRIYTASGVTPYTIDSNMLDAYVNLVPGTYNLTVRALDKCGHTFNSQLSEVVTAGSDAYLYGAADFFPASGVARLNINSNGTLTNPNGTARLPISWLQSQVGTVAVDPGGWFVYASSKGGIYGYQINRSNGALVPIPGSPFPLNQTLNAEELAPTIVMDPTGNFIYVAYTNGGSSLATYRIHRSSGALTWTGWSRSFGPCVDGLTGLTTDFTGRYLYVNGNFKVIATDTCGSETYGLKADPDHGFLTSEVPGSPYSPPSFFTGASEPVSTGSYLYLIQNGVGVLGYSVNPATGALSTLTGSPFFFWGLTVGDSDSFFADWKTRFLWVADEGIGNHLQALAINRATGDIALAGLTQFPGTNSFDLAEDHTGQFVFFSLDPFTVDVPPAVPEVVAWAISSNGGLTKLNSVPVSTVFGDAITSIAVARKNPI